MSKTFTLSEIANVVDCEHKTAPKVEVSEYYSIRTTDILNGRLDFDNANRVSHDTYVTWTRRAIPQTGDLILAREAPVGEVGYIKDGYKVCLGQRTVLIQVTNDLVDKKYLLYYLANPRTKHDLRVRSTGSVVAHLNMKDIRAFEVDVPSLKEQKAITAVLATLDDKIDLLHRQNKTLEALAQTLFRHWFIDGADDDWEEQPLTEFIDFLEGPGIRNWQYVEDEDGINFINIRLIQDGDINLQTANKVSREEAFGKYAHFLLEERDMIVSTSGTLGRSAIVRSYHLPLCLNTSVIRFRPVDGIHYSFMYQYLQSEEFLSQLTSMASGSVQLNFGPTHLKRITMTIPSDDLLDDFEEVTNPLYQKLNANFQHMRTLEKLRDTLLPKLMSGQVRVRL